MIISGVYAATHLHDAFQGAGCLFGKFSADYDGRGEGCQLQHHYRYKQGGLTGGFNPAAITDAVFESEVTLVTGSTLQSGDLFHLATGAPAAIRKYWGGLDGTESQTRVEARDSYVECEGGEGQFDGAGGVITSNFTVSETGEVNDYHLGVIYLK